MFSTEKYASSPLNNQI